MSTRRVSFRDCKVPQIWLELVLELEVTMMVDARFHLASINESARLSLTLLPWSWLQGVTRHLTLVTIARVTNSLEVSKFFLANTPSLCSWLGFSNQWAIGRETWTRNSRPGAIQIEIYRGLTTLHGFLITIIIFHNLFFLHYNLVFNYCWLSIINCMISSPSSITYRLSCPNQKVPRATLL